MAGFGDKKISFKDKLEGDKRMDGEALHINGVNYHAQGDLERAEQNYRQAITAAGMGCQAAIDCERWLEENIH